MGTPLTGHTSVVNGVAFSPDGTLLASTSQDGTVRLWDPVTGHPVGTPLTGHTSPVRAVAFSPDGTLLATASADRTVRLWDPALLREPLSSICSRLGPPSAREWQQYAPDEPLPTVCP